MDGMIAIMTVTGRDHTGIVAAVATACADLDINIRNISQTIMDEWFTMILHVGLPDDLDVATLDDRMAQVEDAEKLVITVQSQAIFDAMHHI
jgi:ACT domain-containing protein